MSILEGYKGSDYSLSSLAQRNVVRPWPVSTQGAIKHADQSIHLQTQLIHHHTPLTPCMNSI